MPRLFKRKRHSPEQIIGKLREADGWCEKGHKERVVVTLYFPSQFSFFSASKKNLVFSFFAPSSHHRVFALALSRNASIAIHTSCNPPPR